MTNVANVLKTEISRVARKEVRSELQALKKASSSYRSQIAALKRRSDELDKQLRELSRSTAKVGVAPAAPASAKGNDSAAIRFSAKGFASHRRRLELSAAEIAKLLGTSTQTIYNWEHGISRPLAKHLGMIAALRTVGKKQVAAHLASLE